MGNSLKAKNSYNRTSAEVAQLVEHLFEEQRVAGSSPALSTNTKRPVIQIGLLVLACLVGRSRKTEARVLKHERALSRDRAHLAKFEISKNFA